MLNSIVSARMNITIRWTAEPMHGQPLTRVWRGPGRDGLMETVTEGDTLESRDREVAGLLANNERFGHDWTAGD